jgi:hypothetical protein
MPPKFALAIQVLGAVFIVLFLLSAFGLIRMPLMRVS